MTALDAAKALKTQREEVVDLALAAELEAREKKQASTDALTAQTDEEATLDGKKNELEEERTNLQFALDTAHADAPASAKDAKKLVQILRKVEVSEAMLAGVVPAVGAEDDFSKMMITEACKALDSKMAEVLLAQANWDTHCAEMAAKTAAMTAELEALTAAHKERMTELQTAKTQQKEAAQGVKTAEATQKDGRKALDFAKGVTEQAVKEVTDAADIYQSYEFLFSRKAPEPPAEEPKAEETMEAPAVETEAPAATEEPVAETPVETPVDAPAEAPMDAEMAEA